MLEWIAAYRKDWLRPDVIAGLTCAAVVIPKAMAYATVAGLPIQVGLYTAFVPMVIYAFLGSSRVLSVTTTTTIAILVAATLADVAPTADPAETLRVAATLTLLVGVFLAAASLFRLLDQLPKLLGVHFHKGTFLQNILSLIHSLPELSVPTLAIGLGAIAVLFLVDRYLPRAPAPLVAIGAGIAAMAFFGLGKFGVEAVGEIPRGLPQLRVR
jgi:MFS superfamily sulfate permease-like transporter